VLRSFSIILNSPFVHSDFPIPHRIFASLICLQAILTRLFAITFCLLIMATTTSMASWSVSRPGVCHVWNCAHATVFLFWRLLGGCEPSIEERRDSIVTEASIRDTRSRCEMLFGLGSRLEAASTASDQPPRPVSQLRCRVQPCCPNFEHHAKEVSEATTCPADVS